MMCKKEEEQDRISAGFCESCNECCYERYTGTKQYDDENPMSRDKIFKIN